MVEIEIDGQTFQAKQGAMIIEVADANGVQIPRFCYHEKLSVAANCRMCLVEVEKAPKTLPACATPVTPGMKVFTQSQKAKDSQRAVMEFLLINHPLDCPICDQGGECELQDNSMGYGAGTSPYHETKRVVQDEDIGPLVATDLTRCIQCTRCVRFGQEIAGLREIGMTQRGEDSEIRTFVKHNLASEVSANIIDLCPVGALTSKPFRFTARAWELQQSSSVSPHDALGSNLSLHTRGGELMRVVPKRNEAINEIWLSDRDRFSYTALKHTDRLLSPMVKRNGQWFATDWETALNVAIKGLKAVQQKYGANHILAQSAPHATLEEYYLLSKICQQLDTQHLSFLARSGQDDFSAQPHFALPIAAVDQQKNILFVGSNIHRELPVLGLRFRKAALSGAKVFALNPYEVTYSFPLTQQLQALNLAEHLAAILKALDAKMDLPLVQNADVQKSHQDIANALRQEKSFIYVGALVYHGEQAALIRMLVMWIAKITGANWGMHTDGPNAFGLARVHRMQQLPLKSCLENLKALPPKGVLLHQLEPELDCANPYEVSQYLSQAEMLVALTSFKTPALMQYAHVLLPVGSLGESSGSYVNLENKLQSFTGCTPPPGETRPAWKVLRVMGNLLHEHIFSYTSSQEVLAEIQAHPDVAVETPSLETLLQKIKALPLSQPTTLNKNELYRLGTWPIYRVDALVRRSEPLQNSGTAITAAVYVNEKTFASLKLSEDNTVFVEQGGKARLPVYVRNDLPDQVAFIPAGFAETANLGECFGKVTLLG